MGKSGCKKKKRHKYTKSEFTEILCGACNICPDGSDPKFCYDYNYKGNPKMFSSKVFKYLVNAKDLLLKYNGSIPDFYSDGSIENIFVSAFCKNGYCKERPHNSNGCDYLAGCLQEFRKQVNGGKSNIILFGYKSRKKLNKKDRYIAQPYPTFFCNKGMAEKLRITLDRNNL